MHKQLDWPANYPGDNKTSNFILSSSTSYPIRSMIATGYEVTGIYPLQKPLIIISVQCYCITSCICAEDNHINLTNWL